MQRVDAPAIKGSYTRHVLSHLFGAVLFGALAVAAWVYVVGPDTKLAIDVATAADCSDEHTTECRELVRGTVHAEHQVQERSPTTRTQRIAYRDYDIETVNGPDNPETLTVRAGPADQFDIGEPVTVVRYQGSPVEMVREDGESVMAGRLQLASGTGLTFVLVWTLVAASVGCLMNLAWTQAAISQGKLSRATAPASVLRVPLALTAALFAAGLLGGTIAHFVHRHPLDVLQLAASISTVLSVLFGIAVWLMFRHTRIRKISYR